VLIMAGVSLTPKPQTPPKADVPKPATYGEKPAVWQAVLYYDRLRRAGGFNG